MRVNNCPCCDSVLLRHARREGVYWFCTSCHQEMVPLSVGQLSTYLEPVKRRSRALEAVKS
jgi:ribosomal protein L37AE/L43A